MKLDNFGRDFLRLTLEIEKQLPGYMDAYLGPEALKAAVEAEAAKPVAALVNDLAALRERIPTEDPQRYAYLRTHLRAVGGVLELLGDEQPSYSREVEMLFDVTPRPVPEERFTAAHRILDNHLPGKGGLRERNQARRQMFELEAAKLMPLLELAREETRRRTVDLVALPAGEDIELRLTRDQHWSAYNWYLGNGHSLVEFNTDIPVFALDILNTMAHEAYPGHHTEAVLKERRFLIEAGYGEVASFLLLSPAAVIAEGIATTALEVIFPGAEAYEWNEQVLLPAIGKAGVESAAQMKAIEDAERDLRYVATNAAYYYHTGRFSQEEAIEYLESYELSSRQRAEQGFNFFTQPPYRAYTFTYTTGYDLITAASGEDKRTLFRRLLTELWTPSALAELADNHSS
ncbi:MAG: hypothetical protein L0332_06570 [Chloroflexi bacterium]|nr:hypothetical protein [Chloroflexota bacterium]MCI0575842.1 hypothetical protein [Chloroflexota bacterium]MCI0646569.1 hypothetical protein [Chloroflexota bacterium]MCI0726371.1 hypothetical protein [Chloroflexota bacterium]